MTLPKIFLLFMFGCIASGGHADAILISMGGPSPGPPVNCHDSWLEVGVPMQLVPIPPGQSCSFTYGTGILSMAPARLLVNLSLLGHINFVRIFWRDDCGIGCTTADFLEGNTVVSSLANTAVNTPQFRTFTNTTQAAVDAMRISSLEGAVFELLIDYTPENTGPLTEFSGPVFLSGNANPLILQAPNGNCFELTVNNAGALTTTPAACP